MLRRVTTRTKLSQPIPPRRRGAAYTDPVLPRRSHLVPPGARGELAAALQELRDELTLPAVFPPDVQAAAERAASAVSTDPAAAGLADLREIEFLTIDPVGSTDLDQALHLERTASGAVLHYAIADVPAYVAPDGPVDAEARRRGQTLYAPDGRIPQQPPVLSEDAASLLPGCDRRAYVWRFELDEGARPRATTLVRGIVRSRAQWSYEDAQQAIEAGAAPASLAALAWFGHQRAERERERGGASLNMPETRVIAEGDGYRIEQSDGVPLEDWNAHVSLLTGMTAAEIMVRGKVGILRTMPPADPAAIAAFRAQTIALGRPWAEAVPYGDYLRSLGRGPLERAVREYAAGLFRGAGYVTFDGAVPDEIMQAAIGAPYAHTTAPLRRLVDRWSLVICEALANGREVPAWARGSLGALPDLMARSSQKASQLAAGALDRVEAALLHGREGQEFTGIVLRQAGDGARVQLHDPPVVAKIKELTAAPGTAVRLRLTSASVADGVVTLVPA